MVGKGSRRKAEMRARRRGELGAVANAGCCTCRMLNESAHIIEVTGTPIPAAHHLTPFARA